MTAPSTLPDLLPCPFCGGKRIGWRREYDADGLGVFWSIKCQDCMGSSAQHLVSNGNDCPQFRQEVRDSWNRRAHPTPPLQQQACDAAASEPQCVPVSAEQSAEIDAAIGLKTLPPIRLSDKVYAAAEAAAQREGIIIQAWVRRQIENATTAAASDCAVTEMPNDTDVTYHALTRHDEVLIAIKRPEDYEDVAPELVVEDFTSGVCGNGFEWRIVEPLPDAASSREALAEEAKQRLEAYGDAVHARAKDGGPSTPVFKAYAAVEDVIDRLATSPAPAPHAGRETTGQDKNTGHGHVFPRPDGVKARCGGPGGCKVCQREAAMAATPGAKP